MGLGLTVRPDGQRAATMTPRLIAIRAHQFLVKSNVSNTLSEIALRHLERSRGNFERPVPPGFDL